MEESGYAHQLDRPGGLPQTATEHATVDVQAPAPNIVDSSEPSAPPQRRDSTIYDFRGAAAQAGLYPKGQIPHDVTHLDQSVRSAFSGLKSKLALLWTGHAFYAKLQFFSFILISFVSSFIIWGIEHDRGVSYVDALFTCVSCICVCGLLTTDLSAFHHISQVVCLILMLIGCQIFTTIPLTLAVRRKVQEPLPRKALTRLVFILVGFLGGTIFVSFLVFSFYMLSKPELQGGVNPFWFGIFHSIAALGNAGIALYPDSMMRFQTDVFVCLYTAWLILIGYTGFPVVLRGLIWLSSKFPCVDKRPSLMLLHTPTFAGQLLPRLETIILAIVLFLITTLGTSMLLGLDWNRSLGGLGVGDKILAAFFNDVNTRSAGFNSIDFSMNRVAENVLVMLFMYIAGYPVGVRIVQTVHPHLLSARLNYYTKRILISGKWWLAVCTIAICVAETDPLDTDPNFTFYRLLFEVISAYGNCGISLGFPGTPLSFCSVWSTFSKCILMVLMMIGRHRKLRAALLSSMHEAHEMEHPHHRRDIDNPQATSPSAEGEGAPAHDEPPSDEIVLSDSEQSPSSRREGHHPTDSTDLSPSSQEAKLDEDEVADEDTGFHLPHPLHHHLHHSHED